MRKTPGIAGLTSMATTLAHPNDEQRLTRGAAVLDDLYQYLRNQKRR